MATETNIIMMIKLICDGLGCVEYEDLLEKLGEDAVVNALRNSEMFTLIEQNNSKKILVNTKIKRCKTSDVCMKNCPDLHLCKYHLLGQCTRPGCNYGHSLKEEHNSRVLRKYGLQDLNRDQLRVLLLQNDGSLLPNVCVSYNKGGGGFGNCPEKETCKRLHVCEKYIRGLCDGNECNSRSHDFYEPHPAKTLHARGISSRLIGSLLQIYRNILILKDHRNARDHLSARSRENPKMQSNRVKEICLWFIKGNCKNGDNCVRVHCDLPYKWQVEVNEVWIDLPDNQVIESDYCNPAKFHSDSSEPVCFDTMTQGLHRVRRLSTESSVTKPGFSHATKWSWYWKDEYNKWIQYGSVKEMHRLSSITSEDLEKKYLYFLEGNGCDVVYFTAGKRFYELNFRVMKQKNELSWTERAVRRRPTFVSGVDVRARISGPNLSSRTGVPGFWDKTAIPQSGFQLVLLEPSHKDYVKVQDHFNKTMKDFSILSIKRVQNKKLWEDFQTKREQIKKANSQKKYGEAERLLFHGTNSKNVSVICRHNFDMRANATMYGQGIYFARDARHSSDYTNHYGERVMFACRVSIGQYTKGASRYRRPPVKTGAGSLYDSCVNDVRNPTIYVVFDRSQVYPEFLITYKKTRLPKDNQSSIFNVVGQTASSGTSSQFGANAISSNSSSTEMASSSASMPRFLASPLNPDLQGDDEMMLAAAESLPQDTPESEQFLNWKPIPTLRSDQGLVRSVTNPVSSDPDSLLVAAETGLTDDSLRSEKSIDQNKTSILWTCNLSTERMSPKSEPLKSPELNKSMSDSLDLITCSSDKAKIFDVSSSTCLSEEGKTTIPGKSHKLSFACGSWLESLLTSESLEVSDDANPKKPSLGLLSSTGLSRKPASEKVPEQVPVFSQSDQQLPILDKPITTDRGLSVKSKPDLLIRQSYLQHDSSAARTGVVDNYSHPLASISMRSSDGKLGSDSSPGEETDKRSHPDGSSSSSSVFLHESQPLPSVFSSTPINIANPRQSSQQRKGLGAQNEQKQKCSLQ